MNHPSLPTLRRVGLALTAAAALSLLSACGGRSEADLLASGQEMLQKKDYSGATIQFKSALQANPDSPEARFLLGQTLLESGDPVSALVELNKARELQMSDERVAPPIARAMLMVGDHGKLIAQLGGLKLQDNQAAADLGTSLAAAHLVQGDAERATQLVNAALLRAPGFYATVVLQARLKAVGEDLDGALALLEPLIAKGAPDDRAGLLKAEVLWLGKKQPEAALAAFREVLKAHPRSVTAHTSAIALLGTLGRADEAKAQIAELKKAVPNHPETLFHDAQLALSDGEFKRSREITDRLLKVMPDNPRVLEVAGAAELRLRQFAQAEAFLVQAVKGAPNSRLARQLLAQAYLSTNQPAKAVEALTPILESQAPDGLSASLAGQAWSQLGDTAKADRAFAQAEKLSPSDNRVRTTAALAQMQRGNPQAAAQLEAIAADDKGTRADLALVMARLRQNDLDGALKAIDGLERKQPERPIAANLRGRVLLLKRDTAGATKAFEAALAKDPAFFPAVASLAALDVAAGKPDAARQRLQAQAKARPNRHEAWLALAELAVRTGDAPQEVEKLLREGVKANKGDATPHVALVNHLIGRGDARGALTAAREAAAALPRNADALDALGRAQLASNVPEEALATFKELVTAQPNNPALQVRIAEAHIVAKDPAAAGRALDKALELRPSFAPALRGKVSLAMMQNQPEAAVTAAKAIQKALPKEALGFTLEGDVHQVRKSWDAAIAAYQAALNVQPGSDSAARLHNAMVAAGRSADAERMAADWLRKNPKDTVFRFHLGDMALARNNLPGAEAHYRAVLEAQPNNAMALNNIAWLMVNQRKPGALALAEKANQLMPGRPQIMDTLALALAAEGQLPKAIETQKAALARQPGDPALKLGLAKLLIRSGDKAYARAELEDIAKLGDRFAGQAEVAALLKTL